MIYRSLSLSVFFIIALGISVNAISEVSQGNLFKKNTGSFLNADLLAKLDQAEKTQTDTKEYPIDKSDFILTQLDNEAGSTGSSQKGLPSPMTNEINSGRWIPGFEAQDEMLDKFRDQYKLQKQDWRPKMYEDLKK